MSALPALEVGFEYRSLSGQDTHERTAPWQATPLERRTAPGKFSLPVKLPAGQSYEYRVVVKYPLLTLYGQEKKLAAK